MHAYLIISDNPDSALEYAKKIASESKMQLLPTPLQKISDTKSLISFASLKIPNTAIFIENIDTATDEALNAFLKTLEEIADDVVFILTSKSEASVLPTISSRCQIIRINSDLKISSQKAIEFLKLENYQKLAQVWPIKDRTEAIEYLRSLIYSLQELLNTSEADYKIVAGAIKSAEKTKLAISQNGNVGLQLANFAINL